MKLEISRQIFEKYSDIVMKIRRLGIKLFHAEIRMDRQALRHVEVDSRFSQFCEGA
jgi:hypothetical protein